MWLKLQSPMGLFSGRMNLDMWYVELAVGGSKVHACRNDKLVWRHIPGLRAHTVWELVRPLRRALHGLDPRTIASIFSNAICVGENKINGDAASL
ncbi:Hypothetical predicted protein [Olea europaea subsp. europaea]|uniref:Uncharacterized protein n=1 Tax=Olea europaea subsp. europaea TaxID=158383 RepID=A0A8S0T973_OLEEU|nr:Hypothetical predicted protein [Olea europaea subsp. europaea]